MERRDAHEALKAEGPRRSTASILTEDIDRLLDELEMQSAGDGDPDQVPSSGGSGHASRIFDPDSHRLLCGDSNRRRCRPLLAGASIQLVNTIRLHVKVEPRSNNAIAAGNSSFKATHHQKLDLSRHPEKSKPTTKKMRAKDRPLANDFVSDEEFDRLLRAWFGNIARVLLPGRSFYIWGGYANCGNYPPVLKSTGLYFSQALICQEHPC